MASTVCKCPRCGKDHKIKINWKGRGKPRKNCNACKSFVRGIRASSNIITSFLEEALP